MTEETTIISKQGVTTGTGNGSSIFGISVRGCLALMLTGSICVIVTANMVMVSLGYTSSIVAVPEPLYSGFIAALAFYYGQQSKKP